MGVVTRVRPLLSPRPQCPGRWGRRFNAGASWSLIWTLMNPVSCVSYVSWMYWVNAADTHETFHWESGMRYQHSSRSPDSCSELGECRLGSGLECGTRPALSTISSVSLAGMHTICTVSIHERDGPRADALRPASPPGRLSPTEEIDAFRSHRCSVPLSI